MTDFIKKIRDAVSSKPTLQNNDEKTVDKHEVWIKSSDSSITNEQKREIFDYATKEANKEQYEVVKKYSKRAFKHL